MSAPQPAPGAGRTVVVDLWVNVVTDEIARVFLAQKENAGIVDFLGAELAEATPIDVLRATMDATGVDVGVLATGLADRNTPALLDQAAESGGRLVVAVTADHPDKPTDQTLALRDLAQHPATKMLRITPLVHQFPLNHRLYYPLYAACGELGMPVSINLGVPGPRVRSACQHPELLEDLLIDFPELTIIGAHMGHPYERLLISYMAKWPSLYLSNSAYLARYLDPELVAFMGQSRGLGRVLFASDHPFLPLPRAIDAARALPLEPAAAEAYLGGTAARLLGL